ncbi:hypothetical protein K523DRAFT_256738 [Schizophyllum commune Tattone D]|nr:hypothetical protein K525DRAFT_264353 [Schizophyllum commune Loenen D]KAI5822578.1 hypothetical protein K523DRAFT_256738 [Schizophyllum commune Tattone D]
MMLSRASATALFSAAVVLAAATESNLHVQCYKGNVATIDMNTVFSTIDAFCTKAADMAFGPHTVDSYSQRAFYVKNQVVLEIENKATCSFVPTEQTCKSRMRRPLHACVSQGSWTYGGHVTDGCATYTVKPQ